MIKRFPFFPFVCSLLFVSLYSERLGNVHQGRYMHHVELLPEEYEIVVPRKVKQDGEFISHQIPHHFKRSFYENEKSVDMTPDDALHYRLKIEDEEHHLELYPNHRLVAPGAVIEEHEEPKFRGNSNFEDFLDNVKLRRMRDTQCHYQGRVRDHSENSALSTCYGLAGYIRTKRSWYTIEPVAGHDFTKETEHPHIVYKRRANEFRLDDKFPCNVTDNTGKSVAKRAFNSRKGHLGTKETKTHYTLELLVALDKTLLDYRKEFDVENYALTLVNMAAGLFHDVSLGVSMELSIVRMIKFEVEDDEMNLSVNKDIDGTLKHFQEWQKRMNPGDDTHPNHHDCAILIAKTDICVSPSLCGFTGTSTIAGTCDPLKGAIIVRDFGLQTGYHVAHHIGHTLGMLHDVEEKNGCSGIIHHRNGYVETTIMYPGAMQVVKRWSKCSRSYLRSYIEADLGFCLEDVPQDHRFSSMELLPGVLYNGDDQCRLLYRQDARQCDLGISCDTLRCAIPGKGCVSARKPPAEGTPCGEKRWCYDTKCLMVGERPGATDGSWSAWSSWSRCSRSCGSGVSFSVRRCNSPSPSKGGSYCRGDRRRYKICSTNPCEIGAPSFRDVQCAEFDDWVFPEDGRIHRWTAYNLPENLRASENPCALYCLSETNLVVSLRPKVIDGTTCYRGIRDICIDGICREIPCDLDMESNAVEDVCGVCKGDSTSCRLKEGTISLVADTHMKKVLNVPVGSTNVQVEETKPSNSRFVVRSRNTKTVLIYGNRLGMYEVAGTRAWLGMIRPRQEALNIPGPVTEDLVILVLPKENVTLKYSLGLKERNPRKPVFTWEFIDWEKCSANCGPGVQISMARCVEKVGGLVDDKFCKNITKPDTKVRPCNQAPCLPRWMIGDWQGCTPCVAGCEKRRAVNCVRPLGHAEQDVDIIADSYCQGPKPKEHESCAARRKRADALTHESKSKSLNKLQTDQTKLERSVSILNENKYDPVKSEFPFSRKDSHDYAVSTMIDKPKYFAADTSSGNELRVNRDSTMLGKRSKIQEDEVTDVYDIPKDEVVVDKEDIKKLTLTIILERDDENNILNFPKNFKPQPPANSTEVTLVGMDAVRYIQMIQEEKITTQIALLRR